MTSKELLKHIKNAPAFKGGDYRYMFTSNSALLYDKDIDTIEKDLEVLEILKKYIRTGQWSNEYTLLSWEMKSEEPTKIKKWLEEEQ